MWLLGNLTLHMRYSLNFDQMVWIGRLNFDGGGHMVFPRPHVLLIDFLCIFHLVGLHHLTLKLAMLTYFPRAFFRNCGGGKSNEVSRRGVGREIIEHDCCIRWPLLSKGQWKVNLVWLGREKTIKFRCLGWEGDSRGRRYVCMYVRIHTHTHTHTHLLMADSRFKAETNTTLQCNYPSIKTKKK